MTVWSIAIDLHKRIELCHFDLIIENGLNPDAVPDRFLKACEMKPMVQPPSSGRTVPLRTNASRSTI